MSKYTDYYSKRGRINWKERKLIDEINAALKSNPSLLDGITPATNFKELEQLHVNLIATDAKIIEDEDPEETAPEEQDDQQDSTNPVEDTTTNSNNKQTEEKMSSLKTEQLPRRPDPFNKSEPVVRDYVLDDGFEQNPQPRQRVENFAEPTNFSQAFDIPDLSENSDPAADNQKAHSEPSRPARSESKSSSSSSGDDNDPQRAKRRSKRFAKSIVDMVCSLAEFGFIYWTTSNINENKLAEYELSGEYDLNLLLDMGDGTETTVKNFFLNQLGTIQEAAKFDKDDREDLTDALAELFVEQNIQPSPKWDLALSAITIFGKKALIGYTIVQQQKAVLEQLRVKKESTIPTQGYSAPQPSYTPPPAAAPDPTVESFRRSEPTPVHATINDALDKENMSDMDLIQSLTTGGQETKE